MAVPHRKIPALTQQEIDRFWSKVRISEGCWDWQGAPDEQGYGMFKIRGFMYRANRVAFCIAAGTDPGDMMVCHTCDRPPCCRPDHLFPGTNRDNILDAAAKGRLNGFFASPEWQRIRLQHTARGDKHWSRRQPELAARGERNGAARFDTYTVRSIRSEYEAGGVSHGALAQRYGVCSEAIRKIVLRKTWKHV